MADVGATTTSSEPATVNFDSPPTTDSAASGDLEDSATTNVEPAAAAGGGERDDLEEGEIAGASSEGTGAIWAEGLPFMTYELFHSLYEHQGGWGNADSAPSTPVSSKQSSHYGGQGGKPLGGTPVEDRGKWKLIVTGLGNDGAVKTDDLKAAFEAKGATVPDAHVPEGRHFGFVSFNSQEDGEKYGTMMNGTKPFPTGRFLRIEWAQPRNGGGSGGGRNCFKCQQSGHMANNCPGIGASASSAEGTTDAATDTAASGGIWGDGSSAASEPAAFSGGGWADSSSTLTQPPSSGRSNNAGGQGGKPIGGTPAEDRGKWKLRVYGIGNDGAVKADDLKAAFEAKGATVPDAYVPEGKPFGFVSFSSQEDAEKYGTMMNGTKPFPAGRPLQIDWALVKGGGGGAGGGRNCFKCQQPGHMANNCPGVGNATPSSETATTDSWGASTGEVAATTESSGGGWGDAVAAPTEAAVLGGGWGDAVPSTTEATSNGGDWGSASSALSAPVPSSAGRDRSGQGGKPITGTPMEDRGKWKLRVVGFGDDGSIKTDDLKAAFEAKGATVADAFVPEGKHFGFISFSTQEDAEKYGAVMNGSKPFANGRFLKVEWALPKGGAGGGGGGGRNCFKCQQPGHMASNCPGVGAGTSSAEVTTDSWGSAPATDNAANGGGSWGDTATLSDEPASTSGGGWGDAPAASNEPAASGGSGWGDATASSGGNWGSAGGSATATTPARSNHGGGGQGGKPIGGTPVEDRGKWKLRVFGIGNDGAVKADDLKAAFEAKGATVPDAYVPEGKPFGFISFSTQEDAEKYGTMMNGAKPFPGGRYLQIDWALAKGGGGGGGRNCFKCQQPGHMANNCPGASSITVSAEVTTDSWGGAPATDTTVNGGGGWDDSTTTSTEPATASGGGWGDAPAAASTNAGSSGGLWGDGSSMGDSAGPSEGGWGDSSATPSAFAPSGQSNNSSGQGKPLGGTPMEDRGKWKLRVVGFGDDGAVKTDDLKAAFEAKGATVADAYVPEGKHFGFISFNSQEDGEKYGTMMNGTKPFPNGRPLRIEWAQPRNGGGGGGGGGGGRNCFKCQQPGHMANSCPGVSAPASSTDPTATSDSWGAAAASESSTAEVSSGGGGWGDAPAVAASESAISSGGWGDTPAATVEAVASGGGWGDTPAAASGGDWGSADASSTVSTPLRSNNGGGGQGGKPIGGTPAEDRGKWKLRVFGIGHDGAVKADDLKAAFEAKGATVPDAYVPEGKPFGFVSFNTQEDAEKYGTMMNGLKPFPAGRPLQIDWALVKGGGGGASGGRNCFKCQQPGHMANNCPGVGNATPSSETVATDSWGAASGEVAATTESSGGGWGDAVSAITEATSNGGGWVDTSGSTGGDWGSTSSAPAPSSAGRDRGGQGGKPITGTPMEDRGKWKLRVVGFGDDGSIKTDDLKAAFEAKGATVADAFVPEGKHFGFISFSTQEDAEKYGAVMNGSKPFQNGRFLKVEWALPKGGAGGGGGRNCFKCQQPGHMANNCPGASAGTSSAEVTTDSWGSAPATDNASTGGGGWGDSAATSTEPASTSGGGWGDAPAAVSTEAVSTGGLWGDGSSMGESAGPSEGGWGGSSLTPSQPPSSGSSNNFGSQGGKPLGGTPMEDRGKWKLRVVGFGDDGAVKTDDLKAAFEAKGATVADAYVPEGKHFGFVSFSSQEEGEKYGTMMNGTKPFANGRFLRIEWAQPRNGGGGPRNSIPSSSQVSVPAGDSWGSSGDSAVTTNTDGGGWGDAPAAATTSDSATTSGGWGDAPAASNEPAASGGGGGWGDATAGSGGDWGSSGGNATATTPARSSHGGGGGQGGKPIGGTPVEDRGKWKLRVFGIGNDGAVKADDLKAAFEAKGATIPDAYVPEGKPFGFISFSSQEDAEKYGTMMNGAKPFPGGRYLQIDWALARGGGGGGGGGRNCFKCQQPGHMANNCPGASAVTVSAEVTTDSWGSTPATDSTASGGGGWGDSATTSAEPAVSSGGGWGDAPAAASSDAGSSGGIWGDGSSTAADSAGSAGGGWGDSSGTPSAPVTSGRPKNFGAQEVKPLGGTPVEDRGKWKLKVTGLGDDGAVKTEDLKAAFQAKGATVADAYVPEGKHFGFVSFNRQEEAEKFGTMLNGTKPFTNGRFLRIEWSQPRNASSSGSGGSRNSIPSSSQVSAPAGDSWGSSGDTAATTSGGGWGDAASATKTDDGGSGWGDSGGSGWGDSGSKTTADGVFKVPQDPPSRPSQDPKQAYAEYQKSLAQRQAEEELAKTKREAEEARAVMEEARAERERYYEMAQRQKREAQKPIRPPPRRKSELMGGGLSSSFSVDWVRQAVDRTTSSMLKELNNLETIPQKQLADSTLSSDLRAKLAEDTDNLYPAVRSNARSPAKREAEDSPSPKRAKKTSTPSSQKKAPAAVHELFGLPATAATPPPTPVTSPATPTDVPLGRTRQSTKKLQGSSVTAVASTSEPSSEDSSQKATPRTKKRVSFNLENEIVPYEADNESDSPPPQAAGVPEAPRTRKSPGLLNFLFSEPTSSSPGTSSGSASKRAKR